jgi:hypothetical protein
MTLTLCRSSMLAQFSLRRLQRYLSIATKLCCLWGIETFRQAPANSFEFAETRHDPAIASSSHDGRYNSNYPRRPWRKAVGLCCSFKASRAIETRSTEQAICSPRTSSNLSAPNLCPSQSSITVPYSVRMGIPDSEATTRSFRTTLSGLVLAGNPVSSRHRCPIYPRPMGTRILRQRQLESE